MNSIKSSSKKQGTFRIHPILYSQNKNYIDYMTMKEKLRAKLDKKKLNEK